jgi:hypothetical protein
MNKGKKVDKLLAINKDDNLEEEYDELELLERLESLREDMEELGVRTLDELIKRIEDLHKRLDVQ